MKTRASIATALLALPLAALALPNRGFPRGPEPLPPCAQAYVVDSVHSSMFFRVKHLDVAYFYGRFGKLEGSVELDAQDASKCSIEVRVDAGSVDTGDDKRDKHLRSADFFNVEEFPSIEFKSKSVAKKDGRFAVTGDLTLHGVTKQLACEVTLTGQADTPLGSKAGFETTFTIQRSDFGMDYMVGQGVDDEVRVTLSLECNKP